LAMKVPGPSPGLLRQIAQFRTRRSWSPLFCFRARRHRRERHCQKCWCCRQSG